MAALRHAAVAGLFYPAEPDELAAEIARHLSSVPETDAPLPKAIIAPHAGYVYSGPVAAQAYARLKPARATIRRVVLLGPSHRVGFRGLALSSAEAYDSPLGPVRIDRDAQARLEELPGVSVLDAAHAQEHSLEVHLPFLQQVLGDFALVPVVVGDAGPQQIAAVLETLWGGPETLLVISSDLSHFLDHGTARELDSRTARAIETLDGAAITYDQACGRRPLQGLLAAAKARRMRVERLDLRNSGDTAGGRDRVVGYGSWAFYENRE
ncbi:AmmeMemoRadiSam system protein B [Telmatospirillum sp. J64-1]|uniref:AmmeMemoRadiSam system protein B n=1 Tax=Telmatospirillum sp. J64-1 TaxID=2502183 RepID=UPI00115EEEB6|nr:AmmeMemoRadiSam system protein B [Telmatospirillum sp. J64-1]